MSPREPYQDYDAPDPANRTAKVTAVLRGFGLMAIVLAFFVVSQQYLSGDDEKERGPAIAVSAASSLRGVAPKLSGDAKFSFGGSGDLAFQIERGAPADVFLSASTTDAQQLADSGRCEPPIIFATNQLALIVPAANPAGIQSADDLTSGDARRLAIGADGVPVGDHARTLLTTLGQSEALTSNAVSEERDAASVVSKVALGSADAGFVYKTDLAIAGDKVRQIDLPASAQPTIQYAACLVNRSGTNRDGAWAFIDDLTGIRGRGLLLEAGFGVPEKR